MIRYIVGFSTMKGGKEVLLTDQFDDTVCLEINGFSAKLTPDELRFVAHLCIEAADRAETRIPETPEEPKES